MSKKRNNEDEIGVDKDGFAKNEASRKFYTNIIAHQHDQENELMKQAQMEKEGYIKHAGGYERKTDLQNEGMKVAKNFINHSGKSPYSKGREGMVFIVDGTPHALIEDNGDRGLFESIGKTTQNMTIKPTTVANFEDVTTLSGKRVCKPSDNSYKASGISRRSPRITQKMPKLR